MMTSEYRFYCGSCRYVCISGIGIEKGPHFSRAGMVCHQCKEVFTAAFSNPGALSDPPPGLIVCKTCGSSEHLSLWDGITCPQCKYKMKAVGANTKSGRTHKYWQHSTLQIFHPIPSSLDRQRMVNCLFQTEQIKSASSYGTLISVEQFA